MIINILKSMGEGTCLRILTLLFVSDKPVCVGNIETVLGTSGPNASRHLKRLRSDGLVTVMKQTQFVYYSLNKELLSDYAFISLMLKQNFDESDECKSDIERLEE
jgi:ArsR family transcriptional regulator